MIVLQQLRLRKVQVFQKLTWQMDKYPFVVIRGRNLDRRSRSGNAVGKSLLAGCIANLVTEAPPITVRKRAANELLTAGARIDLTLRNDKVTWELGQFARGRAVKYEIHRNGKNLGAARVETARRFIQQAFPLSPEHFYSQVYISSFRPSVLWIGSAAQRLDYFEQLFELRAYDLVRRELLSRLATANTKLGQQQLLQRQQEELQQQLAPAAKSAIGQIKQRYNHLLDNYRESNQQIQNLTAYITLAEQLHSDKTLAELKREQHKLADELPKLQRRLRQLQRRWGAISREAQIWRQRSKLQRRLQQLPRINQSPRRQLHRYAIKIGRNEDLITTYQKYERHIEHYHKIIARQLPSEIPPSSQLQQELTELNYRVKQRRKLRPGRNCPVCGQKINRQQHHHQLDQWQRRQKRLERHLLTAKQVEFCHKLADKLPTEILELDLNLRQRRLHSWRKTWDKLRRRHQIYRQRRNLRRQLKVLPKPLQHGKLDRRQLNRLESRIAKREQRQQQIRQDIKLLQRLAELPQDYDNLADAKRALFQLRERVEQITPKLQRLNDRMQNLIATHSNHQMAQRQLRKIAQELDEVEAITADRDILQALVKAYSNRGMRTMQINGIAAAYTNKLNELAPAIYAEPYKFYSEVAPNAFPILAERHGKFGDVRSLSGSESRQYLTISALSLSSLMPQSLRCSHLILDEMESGLAPEEREAFTRETLPAISRAVNNLVVLTPDSPSDLPIPGAKDLTLVRQHGVTKWGN